MADITEELRVISSERSGAAVKQAIHDALDKLNQTANKRPTAKSGVPIDEVIIDTGWITDARIGELIAGEVLSLDGEVAEATESSDVFTGSASLLLQEGGRAFFVAVFDSGIHMSDIPTITDDAGLTWSPLPDDMINVSKYDAAEAPISQSYPNAVIVGFIYGAENLPDPSGYTVNDVIVDNTEGGSVYICTNDGNANEWTELTGEPPASWCGSHKRFNLCIWTAEVSSPGSITVTATLEDSYASFMSVGLFVAYGSNTNYNVCNINKSGREYGVDDGIQGRVAQRSDLPETVTDGDIYYVAGNDSVYKGLSGEWERMTNVYESYLDSKAYSGDNKGLHPGTSRLFLFIGYDPSVREPHLTYVPGTSSTSMARFYKSSGTGTRLTAYHQCAPDGGDYPSFKPKQGNEKYLNLNDGSVAVITIEVGGGLT